MHLSRLLIVDDEAEICALLAESLNPSGYAIEWTTQPREVLELCQKNAFDLILLDIKMPEISGLELLPEIKRLSPAPAVIIMSAFGNIPLAVEAMKRGADDYLEKPFRAIEQVKLAVARLLEVTKTRRENRTLRRQLEERYQLGSLISASPKMQEIFALIRKIGPLNTTVLITGETGTGKELIARALHQHSPRASSPFVAVNCAGLPESLLESLLFGHEKGSFTGAYRRSAGYFEEADGGTLFFDEIGDMPLPLQSKLLRALQERAILRIGSAKVTPVDVRLIGATNRRLADEVAAGRFREDLYYRFEVVSVHLPPLRERREDIAPLSLHFLKKYSEAFQCHQRALSLEAMTYLKAQPWPGNVRQLEHAIERAVALAEGNMIRPSDFHDEVKPSLDEFPAYILHLPLREAKREFERRYMLDSLRRCNGNVTHSASAAGLPRQNFHRKLKQLGLQTSKLADVVQIAQGSAVKTPDNEG